MRAALEAVASGREIHVFPEKEATGNVSVVVPQRISKSKGKGGLLFGRPQGNLKEAVLSFRFREKEFYRRKVPVCGPGGMIKVDIAAVEWPEEGREVQVVLVS